MSKMRNTALAVGLLAALGAAAPQVLAQAAAPAQAQAQRAERPSRIEGRLAFLRTELKITDAQTAQWNAVAEVIRQQERTARDEMRQMREAREQNRDRQVSAVERLEQRERFSAQRAERTKQLLAAVRPLYQTLSDEQKKTADELFARQGGHGRHGGHHRGRI